MLFLLEVVFQLVLFEPLLLDFLDKALFLFCFGGSSCVVRDVIVDSTFVLFRSSEKAIILLMLLFLSLLLASVFGRLVDIVYRLLIVVHC